jgi:hypothetical protein
MPVLMIPGVTGQSFVTNKARRARPHCAMAFSAFVHAHRPPGTFSVFFSNLGNAFRFIWIVNDIAVFCNPIDPVLGRVPGKPLGAVAGFALELRSSHVRRVRKGDALGLSEVERPFYLFTLFDVIIHQSFLGARFTYHILMAFRADLYRGSAGPTAVFIEKMAIVARDADIVAVNYMAEVNSLSVLCEHQPRDHAFSDKAEKKESHQKNSKGEHDVHSVF